MKKILLVLSIFFLSSCSKIDYMALTNTISLDTMKGVVTILSSFEEDTIYHNPRSEERNGSGVIVYEDENYYYALTNAHVTMPYYNLSTEGEKVYLYKAEYKITNYKGDELDAFILHHDEDYDLSVVYFEKQEDLNVIDISSESISKKDVVVSIGNPNLQKNTITYGNFVSLVNPPNILNNTDYSQFCKINFDVIQHSAVTDSGSSGGALLNTDLKLVGINYSTTTLNDEFYATYTIPTNKIFEFLDNEVVSEYIIF